MQEEWGSSTIWLSWSSVMWRDTNLLLLGIEAAIRSIRCSITSCVTLWRLISKCLLDQLLQPHPPPKNWAFIFCDFGRQFCNLKKGRVLPVRRQMLSDITICWLKSFTEKSQQAVFCQASVEQQRHSVVNNGTYPGGAAKLNSIRI